MKNIAVELICDGNSQLGFGHIRRSLSLAKFFQSRFSKVSLRILNKEAQHFIPEDLRITIAPEVVVFDCPYDISETIRTAKRAGQQTVALDGNHSEAPDLNILVFNHLNIPINEKVRVGFEYVIVRPDLQDMKAMVKKNGSILVSIGGGDYLGQSEAIARFLAENGFDVDLVLGPLAKKVAGLKHPSVRVHNNPENFIQLMVECSGAVTNGGGTLFELLYLEKPVWSIPQTPAEERVVKSLQDENCITGVGSSELLNLSNVSNIFQFCPRKQVIDGLGMSRIADLVQGIVHGE